jgi:hypothetical protein
MPILVLRFPFLLIPSVYHQLIPNVFEGRMAHAKIYAVVSCGLGQIVRGTSTTVSLHGLSPFCISIPEPLILQADK